jgi:hypothetical protein
MEQWPGNPGSGQTGGNSGIETTYGLYFDVGAVGTSYAGTTKGANGSVIIGPTKHLSKLPRNRLYGRYITLIKRATTSRWQVRRDVPGFQHLRMLNRQQHLDRERRAE